MFYLTVQLSTIHSITPPGIYSNIIVQIPHFSVFVYTIFTLLLKSLLFIKKNEKNCFNCCFK